MNTNELPMPDSRRLVSSDLLGSAVFDRWGGEDSPACNEDGSPATVEGDEVIVRDYYEDEQGPHFVTERHPIDGKRFYWSVPNTKMSNAMNGSRSQDGAT